MKKLIYLSLIIIAGLSACKSKEVVPAPKAEFTFTINDEGSVDFKSASTNAVKYDYAIDNTHNLTKDFNYTFPANGSYQVTLTATNSEGVSDVVVKTILISNVTGSVMFFKGPLGNQLDIRIIIDGKYVGSVNGLNYYDTAPSCGNQNSVTVTKLSPGSHTYQYNYSSLFFNGTFTVQSGVCSALKIVK